MKGVVRFGKVGKLNPRFIGSYRVIERIGVVTYRLKLPTEMQGIYDIFHISLLRKFISNPAKVIQPETLIIALSLNLSYKEFPVRVLTKDVRRLRNRLIPMVKILWSNRFEREATWESEAVMLRIYPNLFD